MRNLTQDNITQAVLARLANTPDPRLRELMTSLVQHLHAFARDVKLTEDELAQGIRLLTEAGRKTDDQRQEFVLLSDTLGLSMLTVAMNNHQPPGCTELAGGEPSLVRGRVLDPGGEPVPGAVVGVAQAGELLAGPDGRFQFRCAPDAPGPTPDDGPVGEMLRATASPAWRPEHLRFTVDAGGYERLVSDVFRSREDGAAPLEYHFMLNPIAKAGP